MRDQHTADGRALGRLIFEALRLGNALVVRGNELMAPLGLTSARWQVLGTVALLPEPETVAGIARSLSLTRQSVQRVVNELEGDGLLRLVENPGHKRARLVVLTPSGRRAFAATERARIRWTEAMATDLSGHDFAAVERTLQSLRTRVASE